MICPAYFVICAGAPADRADEQAWRATRRIREGPGRRLGRQGPRDAAESLLHDLACAVNGLPAVNLAQSYVLSGGRLLMVPHLIRQLAEAGYTGLVPDDFARPVSLGQIAGQLRSARRSRA